MKKGIAEVIVDIGNENIEYQLLCASMKGITMNDNNATISFYTAKDKADIADNNKEAIVLWVDRDALSSAIERAKKSQ